MNEKMKKGEAWNYAKNITLALAVIFTGLVFVPIIAIAIILKIGDPVAFGAVVMLAPVTINSWFVNLSISVFTILPHIAFIIWAVKDSRKFKESGINTNPFLWGVGMIFPLIFIFLPLYFIRRNITWQKEKQISVADQNTKISKIGNILKWIGAILVISLGILMFTRVPLVLDNQKTMEQVAKIHATRLTMDDVMGKNLPPDPGAEADKTVAGIDANKNGIRDDVELAIFKEYPNSAKTRAVLLQYALALQMEVTQPFENEKNVTEVVREQSRAHDCVNKSITIENFDKYIEEGDKLLNFVKNKQRNTPERISARKDFVKYIGSYRESENEVCDIKLSSLPN